MATATTPVGAASPPTSQSQWSVQLKAALQPRLLRLPLLTLLLLHAIISLAHLPVLPFSLVNLVLLPARPTLLFCSMAAFGLGILPGLVVRRRILSRPSWDAALCPSGAASSSKTITILGYAVPTSTPLGSVLHLLSLRSTWLSAAFEGLTSILFNFALLLSFAAYSRDASAFWLPYHKVPSTRRTTGAFGRVVTNTSVYWRPNELVWCLIVQPFFVGLIASLISSGVDLAGSSAGLTWPVAPLRSPQFSIDLLEYLAPIAEGRASSTSSSTLSARVTRTLPSKMASAAARYAILSVALVVIYLPLRLPLFRLILILLPPYPGLRRLVIPSLRAQHGLTLTGSKMFQLLGWAGFLAAIQGATKSLAVGLWEIYATHPLGLITTSSAVAPATSALATSNVSNAKGGQIETLLAALELYAPTSQASSIAAATSPSEKTFLFTHALFDLAILATDASIEGSERRRRFFKHFAVPVKTISSSSTSLSAWERLSEVATQEARMGIKGLAGATDKPATAPTASASTPAPPKQVGPTAKGRRLEIQPGGNVGSEASSTGSSSAIATSPSAGVESSNATIWQRLVAPIPSSAPSQGGQETIVASQQGATAASGTQPQIPEALTSLWSKLPASMADRIPALLQPSSTLSTNSNATSAAPSTTLLTLLHLLLLIHSVHRLLSASLNEDEWGSVTLSERRKLGVEEWIKVLSSAESSGVLASSTQKEEGQENVAVSEEARAREMLLDEVNRAGEDVKRAFGYSSS